MLGALIPRLDLMLLRLSRRRQLRRLFMRDRTTIQATQRPNSLLRTRRILPQAPTRGANRSLPRRLGRHFSPSEPVSTASRTSRSTVTLFSASQTSSVEGVSIAARRNEIAADFGDNRQAVVRRLWGVSREIVSERPLAATATAATAAAADLAFFRQGAAADVAQTRCLFTLSSAGFKGLIFLRLD